MGTVLAATFLYFLPTLVAIARDADNKLSIFVLNLLLGWTVIGWVIALYQGLKIPQHAK
jgi:Superinfection immunity protein